MVCLNFYVAARQNGHLRNELFTEVVGVTLRFKILFLFFYEV